MFRIRKWGGGPKYHNKRTEGFDSKFERDYSCELDLRVKAGDIKDYQRQVVIPLDFEVDGRTWHIANYKIDFVAQCADGYTDYIEVKGFETPEWRLKWKMFESLYGNRPMTRLLVIKKGR